MISTRGTIWLGRRIRNGKGRPFQLAGVARYISISTRLKAFQPIEAQSLRSLRPNSWISVPSTYKYINSRFASTDSSPTYIPVPTPTESLGSTSSQTSVPTNTFNELAFDGLFSTDQLPITEHIGYLKELGIDFGWGITTSVQWLLEHVHVYSGSPWWASIALTALIVRLSIFPLYIRAMDTSARVSAIQPQFGPLQQRIKDSQATQDKAAMLTATAEVKSLLRTNNIKFRNMFWPLLAQVPIGFCTFRLLRAMADLPVPGMENQGFLWVPDLTAGDPYAIMPLALGVVMYMTFKRGGEIGTQTTMNPSMRTLFQYILPGTSVFITYFMPAALQVTFLTTSLLSLTQVFLFRQDWFRDALGVAKMVQHPPPGAPGSVQNRYPGVITVYQSPSPVESVPPEKKGIVGGAVSEIKGAAKQVLDAAKKNVEQRQGAKPGGRLTAAELRRAKEYEERRKQELEIEKERGRIAGRRRPKRSVR